jgi:peptidoglycan/LPS O-acetylase OafA/YrhL
MPTESATPARYDSLDVWRGVACAAVLFFHAACGYVPTEPAAERLQAGRGTAVDLAHVLATKMWVGVPLFFVISGYCIVAAAVASAARRPRPMRAFLSRRCLRIYPPLWVYLAMTAAANVCLPTVARPPIAQPR